MQQAESGIAELKDKVDSLVIIPNERLKHATDQKITFANAFEIADDVLQQAVQSISDLIKNTGFINLDFADVTTVMKDAGLAHMGVGRAAGKGKAEEAAKMAISSPLLETSINGAHGVLINVTGSMDIGLEEVETAANLVQEAAHPEATSSSAPPSTTPWRTSCGSLSLPPALRGGELHAQQALHPAGAKVEEKKAGEPAALWRSLPPPRRRPWSATTTGTSWSVFSAKSADLIPFYAQPPGGTFRRAVSYR